PLHRLTSNSILHAFPLSRTEMVINGAVAYGRPPSGSLNGSRNESICIDSAAEAALDSCFSGKILLFVPGCGVKLPGQSKLTRDGAALQWR
ncbi:MAG: hypothetical protein WAM85_12835, partial [Terracidiphilus sp.]